MRKLVKWFAHMSIWPKLFFSAVFTAIPSYFAAFLSSSVAEILKAGGSFVLVIHAAVVLSLLTFLIFLFRLFAFYNSQYLESNKRIQENLLHSYTICDRTIIDKIKRINETKIDSNNFIPVFVTSLPNIQSIVSVFYSFLESEFGKSFNHEDRIDFEVTFMTKSYINGEITIPASANKQGRSPHSINIQHSNPALFSTTVTANIYRNPKPEPVIVEDTEDPKANYVELYPGQKKRIQSSIIYPVLSDRNILLGTLVAHCDRKSFFKNSELKTWTDLFEIYSKKIALEKVKMDLIYGNDTGLQNIGIKLEPPF